MKSCTDIEQSKKLAVFLPPESADMCWTNHCYGRMRGSMTISALSIYEYRKLLESFADSTSLDVFYPCWSLTALLGVIRKTVGYEVLCLDGKNITVKCELGDEPWSIETNKDNEVDACYEVILKLHDLNVL